MGAVDPRRRSALDALVPQSVTRDQRRRALGHAPTARCSPRDPNPELTTYTVDRDPTLQRHHRPAARSAARSVACRRAVRGATRTATSA